MGPIHVKKKSQGLSQDKSLDDCECRKEPSPSLVLFMLCMCSMQCKYILSVFVSPNLCAFVCGRHSTLRNAALDVRDVSQAQQTRPIGCVLDVQHVTLGLVPDVQIHGPSVSSPWKTCVTDMDAGRVTDVLLGS